MTQHRSQEAEFLERYGDAIDDRIAEVLDERDSQRPPEPIRPALPAAVLGFAALAGIVLSEHPGVVLATWIAAAVVLAVAVALPRRR